MFCGDTHVQRSNMASVTQHTMIIHTAHESRKLYPSSKAKQLPQAHVAEETETSRSLSPSSFSCQASHALLAVTHQSIVTPFVKRAESLQSAQHPAPSLSSYTLPAQHHAQVVLFCAVPSCVVPSADASSCPYRWPGTPGMVT